MIWDFISQNWWQMLVGIIILAIIVIGIIYRKQLVKKIKKETISFTALCVSLSLTIISFITRQQAETVQLATISGREVNLFFPIVWIFVVLTVVFLIVFFRKELTKEI